MRGLPNTFHCDVNHQRNTAFRRVAGYRSPPSRRKDRPMKPAAPFLAPILAPILAAILSIGGCEQLGLQQASQQQAAALSTPIAPSELDWARKSGTNTVTGLALIESGGTTHSCAGGSANLIPDSA